MAGGLCHLRYRMSMPQTCSQGVDCISSCDFANHNLRFHNLMSMYFLQTSWSTCAQDGLVSCTLQLLFLDIAS
jgi:hypothetical protein